MIEKVFFYLGGSASAQWLHPYLVKHEDALRKQGFLYPQFDFIRKTSTFSHTVIRACWTEEPDALLPRLFSHLCGLNQAEQEDEKPKVLLLSLENSFPYLFLSYYDMSRLVNLTRKAFPSAQVRAVSILSRQDIEYEAYLAIGVLAGGFSVRLPYNKVPSLDIIYDYTRIVAKCESIWGKENCDWIIDAGVNDNCANLLTQFFEKTGFQFHDDAGPTPFAFSPLPQDIIWFVYLSSLIGHKNKSVSFSVDWEKQTAFLSSGIASPGILSPENRKHIIDIASASNSLLFRQVQSSYGFPPFLPDGWIAFSGFTPEHVTKLAERLPPDLVGQIYESVRRIPLEEKTWGFRCMEEGLAALVPNSSPLYLKKKQPKMSVLTLCYNHSKYIEQNIQSVINQKTDFDVQHIISDDGSSDDSREIIMDYAAKYPHIVPLFRRDKSDYWEAGRAVARLFELARTPYVSLCDGDDFFCHPLKLQKQHDYLEENPRSSICFHPVHMAWENKRKEDRVFPLGSEFPPHAQPYNLADLIRWNFMSTPSVMYRWRFQDGLPTWFNSEALPGDWYWHMLHAEVGRIGFIDEVMSVYRRHDGGIWRYAETNMVKHKEIFGIRELKTYISMDEHFKGRFRNIFVHRILYEFYMLYELSAVHGIPKPFEDAIHEFPEWTAKVLEQIKNSAQNVTDEPQ